MEVKQHTFNQWIKEEVPQEKWNENTAYQNMDAV